jgi:hypothetical protein
MAKTCNSSQVHIVQSSAEEFMSKLPWWLNWFIKILFVDLVIALFALGWSWMTKDFSLVALSNRFFVSGVVAILISLASGLGNWENRSDWRQIFAQSAGQSSLTERNQRMMADMVQIYALAFTVIPAGLIAILIAVLLGHLT